MAAKRTSSGSEFARAERAAKFILSKTRLRPRIALVLGSGLGAFADDFTSATRIDYKKIPHFPVSTAIGHAGKLVIGKVGDVAVAGMQGRVHFYEGYSMQDVIFPMRVFSRMGIRAVILTNAAGGIRGTYKSGTLMLIADHINMMARNPLVGAVVDGDERFPDMSDPYDAGLRAVARRVAAEERIALEEGVYAAMLGPSFESKAEIEMMKRLGADAVGMSTVPEVIAARARGIRCLGISIVTNPAAGLGGKLSHQEVLEAADRVKEDLARLVRGIVRAL